MKVYIKKQVLKKALNAVSKAAKSKTLEILRNVAIETEGESFLKLTTTDLETSIAYTSGCEVSEEGKITVNFALLNRIVKLLPEEDLSVETQETKLIIRSGDSSTTFETIDFAEFPTMPLVDDEAKLIIKLSAFEFRNLMQKIVVSVDKKGYRQPVFNSVECVVSNKSTSLASSDGFRLSNYVLDEEAMQSMLQKNDKHYEYSEGTYLLPSNALEIFAQLSKGMFSPVEVWVRDNKVIIANDRLEVFDELFDGDYMDWRKIMPKESSNVFLISVKNLMNAAKLCVAMNTNEDNRRMKVRKEIGKDHIVFKTEVHEIGMNYNRLYCDIIKENQVTEIDFDPKKLVDILKVMNTAYITFEIVKHPRTEHDMLILKEEGNESFFHLITPLVGA